MELRKLGWIAMFAGLAMVLAEGVSEAKCCRGGGSCCYYNSCSYGGCGTQYYYGGCHQGCNDGCSSGGCSAYSTGCSTCDLVPYPTPGWRQVQARYFAYSAWFTVDALVQEPNAVQGTFVSVHVPHSGDVNAWIMQTYALPIQQAPPNPPIQENNPHGGRGGPQRPTPMPPAPQA